MKKAIVTGATGFIGGALTKKLLSQGMTVYGVDIDICRLNEMKKYGDFIPIVADFTTYKQLHQEIKDSEIDCCYHLACSGALGGDDLKNYELQIMNSLYASIACEQATKIGCKRFVIISSSYQYMRDLHTNEYNNIYGLEKKNAEDICRLISMNSNIEYNIAVLTNTFGVGDRSKKAVNTMLKTMINGEKLRLVQGNYKNDWVYIDDTVQGLIEVGQCHCSNKKYYIGHQNIMTFKEQIILMRDVISPEYILDFGTFEETTYIDYTQLDASSLKMDTGFECKADFRESILKTAEWVKTLNI